MESQVAVYNSHQKAVDALEVLKRNNFEMKHVSLLGKAENRDGHLHFTDIDTVQNLPLMIGSGAGLVLGLLAGLSVLAIPGFGFLYGAGAVVGAFAGFDIGMITGGIGTLLATAGLKEDVVDRLTAHLEEGYYLILVKGSLEEVEHAEKLLHTEGTHLDYFR